MGLRYRTLNKGIASRIGNTIYYNKELKSYPELYKSILSHEKEHSSGFNFNDAVLDFKGKHLGKWGDIFKKGSIKQQYYLFILKNPKSLTQFLPLGFYDKKLSIDYTMLILWAFIITWIIFLILISWKLTI